ncbi:hypothetical protein FF124_00585 [Martelella lutilitoris]|uniref:Uncharacterized protein n=1 Tax=Martelella lutilitoris TaxID=2583532 RepID=A0A5C4JVL7_9HYPH|nr:hypothetical protein [Martelella lutilitoris]TNB49493.1 hypothetical protein FF124_00585 [Martelella lutilitoris]
MARFLTSGRPVTGETRQQAKTVHGLPALVFLLFLALPVMAFAQDNPRIVEAGAERYEATFRNPLVGEDLAPASTVTLDWNAELEMGLLYDEPVFSTRFRYDVTDYRLQLPTLGPGAVQLWTPQGEDGGAALPEGAPLVQPYAVRLVFRFYAPSQNAYVGLAQVIEAPGLPGEWAFNMPSSPDWGRTFVWESGIAKGDWVKAETAKAIWNGDLRAEGARLDAINWSTADFMAFLAENNLRNRAIATAEAVNRLLSGAARSFGYEVLSLREDPKAYDQPAFRPRISLRLLRKYERLLSLPQSLKQGDATAYDEAREEARAIMALMEDDAASYADPGPLRADLPRGAAIDLGDDGLQPVFVELPLAFTLIDNGREDVDRVELTISDSTGVVSSEIVDLLNGGTRFEPSVAPGPVRIAVKALSEGALGQNTCTIQLHSTVVKGPGEQEYSLRAGETASLLVFAEAPQGE